jgi:hypothetical protein
VFGESKVDAGSSLDVCFRAFFSVPPFSSSELSPVWASQFQADQLFRLAVHRKLAYINYARLSNVARRVL